MTRKELIAALTKMGDDDTEVCIEHDETHFLRRIHKVEFQDAGWPDFEPSETHRAGKTIVLVFNR